MSFRSKRLSCPNTPVTTGGQIDAGESSINAAIRECWEEHGSIITKANIRTMFRTQTCDNYVAVVDSNHTIAGPNQFCAWEVNGDKSITTISTGAIQPAKYVYLVPVKDLLAKKTTWKHSLISPLCNKLKSGEIILQ